MGYEDSSLNESIEFQGLDAAGNDRKSLERHEGIAIGPQLDQSLVRHAANSFECFFAQAKAPEPLTGGVLTRWFRFKKNITVLKIGHDIEIVRWC